MPFNSYSYYLFLPVVYLLFYFAGERIRWIVLLTANMVFYAALRAPHLPAVLLLVSMITYFCGVWLDWAGTPGKRLLLLRGGIFVNLLILATMKYFPFLAEKMKSLSTLYSVGNPEGE